MAAPPASLHAPALHYRAREKPVLFEQQASITTLISSLLHAFLPRFSLTSAVTLSLYSPGARS